MYERNAIVIDRFFSDIFGYNEKENLKNNYKNYSNLINNLERYQEVSEIENNIMIEFEKTANEIKETQKVQESLSKRSLKLQDSRRNLFDNLEESAETLNKKFNKIEEEIYKNNEEIKNNEEKFISEIADFHEKSESRTQCGRERRIVESEYQKILEETTINLNNINQEKVKNAKMFLKEDGHEEIKDQIKNAILTNGAKEKVPFDLNVITNAIDVATDLEEKKLEILVSAYEKTVRILAEIKNDTVKVEKYKKLLRDYESKLKFLNMVNEYIILFLDNERMNVIGGEKEHKKLMSEASDNLQKDLVQIKNMYELIVKEITNKSTKKSYKELYNPEYLQELKEDEKEFERSVSKLNMIGTVIYPEYWRVDGMQKIYETFRDIITNIYGKDLSEYEPIDTTEEVEDNLIEDYDTEDEDEEDDDDIDWDDDDEFDIEDEEDDKEEETEEDKIDKDIDEILGIYNSSDEDDEEDEGYDNIDFDEDLEDEEDNEEDEEKFDWEDDEDEIEEKKKDKNKKGFFDKRKK